MRIATFFGGSPFILNHLGNLMKGTEVGGRHQTTTTSTDGRPRCITCGFTTFRGENSTLGCFRTTDGLIERGFTTIMYIYTPNNYWSRHKHESLGGKGKFMKNHPEFVRAHPDFFSFSGAHDAALSWKEVSRGFLDSRLSNTSQVVENLIKSFWDWAVS